MTEGDSQPGPISTAPSRRVASPAAWQPITTGGVAAFARASFGRLFLLQLAVAIFAAATVVWFFKTAWSPVVQKAISVLPDHGVVRDQELQLPSGIIQATENRYFGLILDPQRARRESPVADVQVFFHQDSFEVCSLLGCLTRPYPRGWTIQFNRLELVPRWGAWEPILLGLTALAVIALLFVSWTLLASAYCLLPFLLAYFKDREINFGISWRLSGAALMPGAILLITSLLLYGLGLLDLVRLGVFFALHFFVPWFYLMAAPLKLPPAKQGPETLPNPFGLPPPDELAEPEEPPSDSKSKNPFQ